MKPSEFLFRFEVKRISGIMSGVRAIWTPQLKRNTLCKFKPLLNTQNVSELLLFCKESKCSRYSKNIIQLPCRGRGTTMPPISEGVDNKSNASQQHISLTPLFDEFCLVYASLLGTGGYFRPVPGRGCIGTTPRYNPWTESPYGCIGPNAATISDGVTLRHLNSTSGRDDTLRL